MNSFWSSEQQSLTCYTWSPHSFAKIRVDAAVEGLRKKEFFNTSFRQKGKGRFAKVAGLVRIAAPTEAHRESSVAFAGYRYPITELAP
jgi:hypothetical protein